MKIAFSPCPNDTYVFHAWVHGLIPGAPSLEVTYADIDQTNHFAIHSDRYDVLKISCAALPWVLSEYSLLPCGGALGNGCGPLILVPNQGNVKEPTFLKGKRVAVPSEKSTAYLLFRLWVKRMIPEGVGEIVVMPFHQIMPAVRDGDVDAGLVIHEARFTYPNFGLASIVDLGEWWENDTGLPIPLGAIIAKKSFDLSKISTIIRQSVEYAWNHPNESKEYVQQYAQELDEEVVQAHINLYVNRFTHHLGVKGYEAIWALLERSAKEGVLPPIRKEQLWEGVHPYLSV